MSTTCSDLVWKRDFGTTNRKIIAAKLADHADDQGRGIWPSVERTAAQCNTSARTVQRVLASFVKEGLLVVVDEGGKGRGNTRRYDFDMDVLVAIPEVVWGDNLRETSGKNTDADAPNKGDSLTPLDEVKGDTVTPLEEVKGDTLTVKGDTGDTLGCHGDTQTVREPSEELSRRADMREEAENLSSQREAREVEKLFWSFVKHWPGFAGMPKQPARAAFFALADEDQDQAIAKRDDWFALLRQQKKSHTPAPATYCREKLWKDVPDVLPAAPRNERAGPFGKLWCVYRFADLLKSPYGRIPPPSQFQQRLIDGGGPAAEAEKRLRLAKYGWPRVNTMHASALQRKGHVVPSEFSALAMQFEKVRVRSDLWEVWRQEHVQRGWPWLDECNPQEWVWMPGTGQPIDQSNLKEAVRSALTLFEEKLQHLQKDAAE